MITETQKVEIVKGFACDDCGAELEILPDYGESGMGWRIKDEAKKLIWDICHDCQGKYIAEKIQIKGFGGRKLGE